MVEGERVAVIVPESTSNLSIPDEDQVNLLDYVAIVARHLWIVILFGGVTVVATIVFVLTATPIYMATTTLLPARRR